MTDTFATSGSAAGAGNEKPQLPSGLNTLTILTFIGCGVGLLFTLLLPAISKFFLGFMDRAKSSGTELSTKQLADIEKGKASFELMQANMVPIMIVNLLGIVLCLVGAIWMRKLKKDGFWIYVGGELLPLIGSFIILGTAQYTGVASVVMGIGIPVVFVVLYNMHRKYLVN